MRQGELDELHRVDVASTRGRYPVFVGRGALERLEEILATFAPADAYAVISDETVAGLYGEGVAEACAASGREAALFTFPPGEAAKTRKSWSILTDELLEAGFGRDACVVALGGGVTGDLAGFVAATFMRGIPVVQIPTSYLAMIDASVGGKTGVDVRAGKNLVGAFHPPACVVADPSVLQTLPPGQRAQGLVEAFKHGAILDAAYFVELEGRVDALMAADAEAAEFAVRRSVELKAGVVARDEHEAGLRQILNFGHTLGHALEAAADYRVGHGTAVAVGMVLEAELGRRMGITDAAAVDALRGALGRLPLPWRDLPPLVPERVVGYLNVDKKARSGEARFVLLRRLGEVDAAVGWSRTAPPRLVHEVMGLLQSDPFRR